MFRCPECGAAGRIRTSYPMNDTNTTRRKFYQCNNIECGLCFSTLESFEKRTSRQQSKPQPPLPA